MITAEHPRPDASHSQLWYHALLSSDQMADGFLTNISQMFLKLVNAAGAPKGACLFATIPGPQDSGQSDDGATAAAAPGQVIFFSPASVSFVPQLIVLAKGRPGPPPERGRVELLVGSPQDWDLLPRSTH